MRAMKALVLERDKELRFTDVPDLVRPGPGWARIRIALSGICNSDIHRGFGGGAYRYPLVMGHEFSGLVEEPAAGGKVPRGARVTVFPLIPCRRCVPCQTGDFAQCTDYDYLGSRRDGAFAEAVWAPDENLFVLPEATSLRDAALTEPCAVALHGVSKLAIRPGDAGAVFGAGPIGNMAAQWMRLRGCAEVFVVDIDGTKLDLAAADQHLYAAKEAGRNRVQGERRAADPLRRKVSTGRPDRGTTGAARPSRPAPKV